MTHSPTRTTAQAVSDACDLMLTLPPVGDTHPNIFASADAIDVMRQGGHQTAIAGALHDRACQVPTCGPEQRTEHLADWIAQAEVAQAWFEANQAAPSTTVRPYDRRMCTCGHIRMGHSVDGSRCYSTPCECAADGGFREVAA